AEDLELVEVCGNFDAWAAEAAGASTRAAAFAAWATGTVAAAVSLGFGGRLVVLRDSKDCAGTRFCFVLEGRELRGDAACGRGCFWFGGAVGLDGGEDEDAVPPDDRRRAAAAGDGDFPFNFFCGRPF